MQNKSDKKVNEYTGFNRNILYTTAGINANKIDAALKAI